MTESFEEQHTHVGENSTLLHSHPGGMEAHEHPAEPTDVVPPDTDNVPDEAPEETP